MAIYNILDTRNSITLIQILNEIEIDYYIVPFTSLSELEQIKHNEVIIISNPEKFMDGSVERHGVAYMVITNGIDYAMAKLSKYNREDNNRISLFNDLKLLVREYDNTLEQNQTKFKVMFSKLEPKLRLI